MKADIEVFICILLTFSFANGSENIHPACQNMWDNAGNNLVVPHELRVDVVNNANPLLRCFQRELEKSDLLNFNDSKAKITGKLIGSAKLRRDCYNSSSVDGRLPSCAACSHSATYRCLHNCGNPTRRTYAGGIRLFKADGIIAPRRGDLNTNANTFTGFHNWYQFLLEQERNPTQTTNIFFRPPAHLPSFVGNRLPYFLRGLTFRWRGANKVPQGSTSSMFVGTSPAFDLAMFTTCVLKGRAAGGGTTDCVCEIQDPRLGKSTAEFRTIENSQRRVITAYPRNVKS